MPNEPIGYTIDIAMRDAINSVSPIEGEPDEEFQARVNAAHGKSFLSVYVRDIAVNPNTHTRLEGDRFETGNREAAIDALQTMMLVIAGVMLDREQSKPCQT